MSKTFELIKKIRTTRTNVMGEGWLWQHYKGGVYQVEDVVINTDDGEPSVLYYRVAGPDFDEYIEQDIKFSRPAREWHEMVEAEMEWKGEKTIIKIPRFRKVRVAVNKVYTVIDD